MQILIKTVGWTEVREEERIRGIEEQSIEEREANMSGKEDGER